MGSSLLFVRTGEPDHHLQLEPEPLGSFAVKT